RRHTTLSRDWSSDVCSSDLVAEGAWSVLHPPVRPRDDVALDQQIRDALLERPFDRLGNQARPAECLGDVTVRQIGPEIDVRQRLDRKSVGEGQREERASWTR